MSDENTNDSGSGSQIDYNTKHVYFYLPKVPTEDGEVADNIDLGAMLRLGGYCDLEQQAHKLPADEIHYYPQKYIDTQGAGSENIFKKSAGSSTESSHGILMACDGHFLLKAAEKMFVETGDHHLQVNGDYEHDTTGSVNVQSGDIMNLKSGTNKTLTLNAGDKTGDMELLANNKTETVQGDSTSNVTGDENKTTSGDFSWLKKGFDTTYSLKVSVSGFAAGQIVGSSWGFQSFGYLFKIYPIGHLILSGTQFNSTGYAMGNTALRNNIDGLLLENNGARVKTALTNNGFFGLNVHAAQIVNQYAALGAGGNGVNVNNGGPDVRVRALVSFM